MSFAATTTDELQRRVELVGDTAAKLQLCFVQFEEIIEQLARADEAELKEIQKRVRKHLAKNGRLFEEVGRSLATAV